MAQRHLLAVNVVDVSKSGLMLLNNLVGALLISCAVPFHPGEIDRTLKKVQEGVELFDEIWEKVYNAASASHTDAADADATETRE